MLHPNQDLQMKSSIASMVCTCDMFMFTMLPTLRRGDKSHENMFLTTQRMTLLTQGLGTCVLEHKYTHLRMAIVYVAPDFAFNSISAFVKCFLQFSTQNTHHSSQYAVSCSNWCCFCNFLNFAKPLALLLQLLSPAC